MAGQTQSLLQSLVAPGLESTTAKNGSFSYQTVLYVGRGVPDAWITPGQAIAVSNLTTSYNENSGQRQTYGVRIATTSLAGSRVVTVSLSGHLPGDDVQVQLPVFADAGVRAVIGGGYDAATHTVTMHGSTVLVTLGQSVKPAVAVQAASTVAGTHAQPTLTSGTPTTATATFTNTGKTTVTNVKVAVAAPAGWTATAATTASFASVAPGKAEAVTFDVTPPADAAGGNGLVATAAYSAPDSASGSVSSEQWVIAQKPLPLPPGATDLALSATASASYSSPWTTVSALNNGIYPIQSSDDNDLTPYWGDWPMTGPQWIELDWTSSVTTDGTEIYWADDGGGLLPPSSWVVQYWTGTAWADVTSQSGEPTAINTFNQVTFDPVTTTKLRISLLGAGPASVGAIQWVVPSVPS
jgi:hypothetical protein